MSNILVQFPEIQAAINAATPSVSLTTSFKNSPLPYCAVENGSLVNYMNPDSIASDSILQAVSSQNETTYVQFTEVKKKAGMMGFLYTKPTRGVATESQNNYVSLDRDFIATSGENIFYLQRDKITETTTGMGGTYTITTLGFETVAPTWVEDLGV